MTGQGGGQFARLCAGAVLAFAVGWVPAAAQESGGGGPPVATPPPVVDAPAGDAPAGDAPATTPGIKVRADSTGALIPEVQRPPQVTEDEDEPVSGGFSPLSGGAQGGGKAPASGGGVSGALDYDGWERMAVRAENASTSRSATNVELERLRLQLVDWRAALLGAQSANAARIATLRQQIDALGPAPAEGATEAEEIAVRRRALSDQLVRLQAPGLAADEAYRRADGLIGEIDRVMRERQANELLKLWPSPVNPANWADAAGALTLMAQTLWAESRAKWLDERARGALADNVPVILPLLIFALAVLWRGLRWTDRLLGVLAGPASIRGRRIWEMLGSLALIIVPTLGFVALAEALVRSQMLGPVGEAVAENLGVMGLMVFAAVWLGARAFPAAEAAAGILTLGPERRAAGRVLTAAFGVLLALALVLRVATDPLEISDAAKSVLRLPVIVVAAFILLRIGQLIRVSVEAEALEEGTGYRQRLVGLLARAAIAIGLIGPLLAVVGYVSAAGALVFPAALSLGLAALLQLTQRLISDLYGLVTRHEGSDQDALAPVLISFALTLGTLPVFALIWGARVADLTEMWTRFQEGFALGGSRISPTDFLFFAVVFAIGWSLTRLFQGAMKTQVLPRTGMDQGGQNALVSGLGYVGIFVSALVAIRATGIDLSGLAIVAGALSVGIGFGLQTIVSNFVAGIILLIERPISEGDWIEVGPVQGIVSAISVRSTRIQTFDRSDVIVPNSDLISQRVTNWTRFSLTGRLIVAVAVPLTSDGRVVERILREIAEAQPLALLSPPPIVALVGFAGEAMNFEIRVILRDVNFLVEVRSEMNHQIALRFAAEGIAFTNAHRDYLKRIADEAAAAVEAAAEWQAHQQAVAGALDRRAPQDEEMTPR